MQQFMWRTKRVILGVAVPLICLASAELVRAESKLFQDVLHSTGLVEVPHADGRLTYGTCWLVDDEHRVAITSQHVVKAEAEVVVYFPSYRDGTAITELTHYHREVAAVHGRVVHRDALRDLALLQLDNPPNHIKALPLAGQSAGPGDTVHSVGNSGVLAGTLWRYTAGKVRSVYQAEILAEDGILKARIIETQTPINGGDSGGPLVNDRGDLVGVVIGRQKQSSLVSLNVDVSEVKAFLAEVRGPTNAPAVKGASGADRKFPPVQGSWKVTLINLQGEQMSGDCCFQTDGTFTLKAHAAAGTQTRGGRYSYANGVLLMAWDSLYTRETLHWVKDRRFTLLSDEMLIFERQPDAGEAKESALPKSSSSEHRARTNESTNWQQLAPAHQPLGNVVGRPSPDWALATSLIGAVVVLLLLDKALHRQSTNNADLAGRASEGAQRQQEPRRLPPALISQGKVANEGVNDATNHSPR